MSDYQVHLMLVEQHETKPLFEKSFPAANMDATSFEAVETTSRTRHRHIAPNIGAAPPYDGM